MQMVKILALMLITGLIGNAVAAEIATPIIKQANPYMWTELGPKGEIIARYITSEAPCPHMMIDQNIAPMHMRVYATADYPVNVCEAVIPNKAQTASINGQMLALPKADPKKIVIIGDTGCAMPTDKVFQSCNDPAKWPFEKIANQAASWHPDLVIHVGDYHYRIATCPAKDKGCKGNPYGYNWASWEADFFHPAKNLLASAPWVMVRGNHESCKRAAKGWFSFLDPFKYTPTCHDYSPIYTVPMGQVNLVIVDSSAAKEEAPTEKQIKWFEKQYHSIPKNLDNIWLISHKPTWYVKKVDATGQNAAQDNETTLQAAADSLPNQVQLLISGHVHVFQTLNFKNDIPQLIVGNSGTRLETHQVPNSLNGLTVADSTITHGISIREFGYMTLENTANGWVGQARDVNGHVIANCKLEQKQLNCYMAQ